MGQLGKIKQKQKAAHQLSWQQSWVVLEKLDMQ